MNHKRRRIFLLIYVVFHILGRANSADPQFIEANNPNFACGGLIYVNPNADASHIQLSFMIDPDLLTADVLDKLTDPSTSWPASYDILQGKSYLRVGGLNYYDDGFVPALRLNVWAIGVAETTQHARKKGVANSLYEVMGIDLREVLGGPPIATSWAWDNKRIYTDNLQGIQHLNPHVPPEIQRLMAGAYTPSARSMERAGYALSRVPANLKNIVYHPIGTHSNLADGPYYGLWHDTNGFLTIPEFDRNRLLARGYAGSYLLGGLSVLPATAESSNSISYYFNHVSSTDDTCSGSVYGDFAALAWIHTLQVAFSALGVPPLFEPEDEWAAEMERGPRLKALPADVRNRLGDFVYYYDSQTGKIYTITNELYEPWDPNIKEYTYNAETGGLVETTWNDYINEQNIDWDKVRKNFHETIQEVYRRHRQNLAPPPKPIDTRLLIEW